jgi:hypothetical protein
MSCPADRGPFIRTSLVESFHVSVQFLNIFRIYFILDTPSFQPTGGLSQPPRNPTLKPSSQPSTRSSGQGPDVTFRPTGSVGIAPKPTSAPTAVLTPEPSSSPSLTLLAPIFCNSALNTYCVRRSDTLNRVVTGYYCSNSVCAMCPSGTYGTDGKTCRACGPYQSSAEGSDRCSESISQVVPGLRRFWIPPGISKIHVRLWGGGGAGDQCGGSPDSFNPAGGGGGGFSSCNISVTPNSSIYVLVAGGAFGTTKINYVDPGGECKRFRDSLFSFSFLFSLLQSHT